MDPKIVFSMYVVAADNSITTLQVKSNLVSELLVATSPAGFVGAPATPPGCVLSGTSVVSEGSYTGRRSFKKLGSSVVVCMNE